MAATRRLAKELNELRKAKLKVFPNIEVDETNILQWKGLIVPQSAPFNEGAFKIEVNFPAEYPFKPPKVTFKTSIYHPNIDEKGQVCLPIISPENWKPATKMDQVVDTYEGDADHSADLKVKRMSLLPKKHLRLFLRSKQLAVEIRVVQALTALVHDPEPEHPLRGDLAEEFTKDRTKFNKNAKEYTIKYAEKRPE